MIKIKLMTDTACDIPLEEAEKLGMDVLSIKITADNLTFQERRDKTDAEFLEILRQSKTIPTTAGINPYEFLEAFEKQVDDGYDEIIYVSINAAGSSTYQSALTGREMFFEKHEDKKDQVKIHVLDSKSYSLGYGLPLKKAANMLKDGASADSIVSYLSDFFEHSRVYFCVYTLDYAKKSGRISCAAAAVGGLLGIKPIMKLDHSEIKIAGKVRTGKAAISDMCERVAAEIKPGEEYALVVGIHPEYAEELNACLTEKLGYPATCIFRPGAAISVNAGPDLCGVVFYREVL